MSGSTECTKLFLDFSRFTSDIWSCSEYLSSFACLYPACSEMMYLLMACSAIPASRYTLLILVGFGQPVMAYHELLRSRFILSARVDPSHTGQHILPLSSKELAMSF